MLKNIRDWDYDDQHVVNIKFEQITKDPYYTFVEIFKKLGFAFSESDLRDDIRNFHSRLTRKLFPLLSFIRRGRHTLYLKDILVSIYLNDFRFLSGNRNIGEENKLSHYRKGIHGDWKNYFTPRLKEMFLDKMGDLLIRLGYESDNSW